MAKKFKIYVGSSCDTSYPNYGGWAYFIKQNGISVTQDVGSTHHETNNRLCMSSVILALNSLNDGSCAEVVCNNQYCINAFSSEPKEGAKNLDLITLFYQKIKDKSLDVTFSFVQSHENETLVIAQSEAKRKKDELKRRELKALRKKENVKDFDFLIYTDGASNPRNFDPACYGGWGYVVLKNGIAIREDSGSDVHTTNNRMELTAILKAVQSLKDESVIQINTDSQYCIKVLGNQNANIKSNEDIISTFFHVVKEKRIIVEFNWVRGHNGDKWNEYADGLANKAYEEASGNEIIDFKRLKTDYQYRKQVFNEYYNNKSNER